MIDDFGPRVSHPYDLQVHFTSLAIRLAGRIERLPVRFCELINQFDQPTGTSLGKNGNNGARDPQFQVCAEEADCDVQETLARSASGTATRLLKKTILCLFYYLFS